MGRYWVLDTDTKGTGAEMVPLEKILRKPDPKPERRFVGADAPTRPEPEPAPQRPPSFRVNDVMTGRVLAEGVGTHETVVLLEGKRSVVDVTVDVWDAEAEGWHRLTHGERRVLWDRRGRRGRAGAARTPG
jgi:hypothetical protein